MIDQTAISATAANVVRLVREMGPILLDGFALVELALNEIDWASMIEVRGDGQVDRSRIVAILLAFGDAMPDLTPVEELS